MGWWWGWRGWRLRRHKPCQISFNFIHFSAKFCQIIGWRSPLELVPPARSWIRHCVGCKHLSIHEKLECDVVKCQDKQRVLGLNFLFNYHHQVPQNKGDMLLWKHMTTDKLDLAYRSMEQFVTYYSIL